MGRGRILSMLTNDINEASRSVILTNFCVRKSHEMRLAWSGIIASWNNSSIGTYIGEVSYVSENISNVENGVSE